MKIPITVVGCAHYTTTALVLLLFQLGCFCLTLLCPRYYWYIDALGASTDIETVGSFNWRMYICLFFAWLVVYLCIFKGIISSGKVMMEWHFYLHESDTGTCCTLHLCIGGVFHGYLPVCCAYHSIFSWCDS